MWPNTPAFTFLVSMSAIHSFELIKCMAAWDIFLPSALAQWHSCGHLWSNIQVQGPEMTPNVEIIFPWESDSDKNGQSTMRGSDVQCLYTGIRQEYHPSPGGTGPAGRAMACRLEPRGITYSSLCFWTRAAAPGIHLGAPKPPIRVQIGQRGPTSPWHQRKLRACALCTS